MNELNQSVLTIQEILNIVIESGCYGKESTILDEEHYKSINWNEASNRYMCSALYIARQRELITFEDCSYATNEIMDYIYSTGAAKSYLSAMLKFFDQPHEFEDCLKIYQDWNNRPFKNQG